MYGSGVGGQAMNLRIARHVGCTVLLVFVVALVTACSSPSVDAQGNAKPAGQKTAAAGTGKQAPMFEVDPYWPKPLPNHWVTGSTIGLSVDAQDNVWTIHRPNTVEDNFRAADIHVGDARGRDDEALPGAAAAPQAAPAVGEKPAIGK